MLVVDASVAVGAVHTPLGFAKLRQHELVAPHLMLFEASSVLHELAWRKEVSSGHAAEMFDRLEAAPIELRSPTGLVRKAWEIADALGWAKTYDAQYVALAQLLDCRLLTLDERLIRGIERLGIAVRPREL